MLGTALERPREGFRVQLDPIGAGGCGPPNGIGLGVDEEADADAARLETSDHLREAIAFGAGLPAGLAGHFSRHDWDERALVGAHLIDQIQQLGARIAFDVEFNRGRQRPQHARRSRGHRPA